MAYGTSGSLLPQEDEARREGSGYVASDGHQPEPLIFVEVLAPQVDPQYRLVKPPVVTRKIERRWIEAAGKQQDGRQLTGFHLWRNAQSTRVGRIGGDHRDLAGDVRSSRIASENDR